MGFDICSLRGKHPECTSPKFLKYTLQGTNISPKNGILKMIFLFPRWDMLIPWRVTYAVIQVTWPENWSNSFLWMHFANAVPLDKTHPEQFGGGQQFSSLFQLEADIWPAMFAMLHQGLINITSSIQTSEPTNLSVSQVLHGYRRLRGM